MPLAAAGLLARSLLAVSGADLGFQAKRTLTMRITMPAGTPDPRALAIADDVLERVRGVPGVVAAGQINGLFDLGPATVLGLRSIEVRDLVERPEQWTALTWNRVGGDYFQAMGAAVLRGRVFSEQDGPTSPLVAVVDESMARRYWAGENPIGKRFKGQDPRGANDDWITVIGVVADMRRHGPERPTAHVYLSRTQERELTPDLIVRTAADPRSIAPRVRSAVRAIDARAILSPITTLEDQIELQLGPRRFQTWLLGAFALVALGLASVGVYGVMQHAVAERQREIGLRMALGAQRIDVVNMMLRETLTLVVAGVIGGLVAASWVNRVVANLLVGVSPADPLTFGGAAVLLAIVACVAAFLPALRASRLDPLAALRRV